MIRERRDRKPNMRLLGDDWDNDEDGEEHRVATVDSGDECNKCSSLGSKGSPVINRKRRHRKRNTRIFGDEWDNNEDGGEHVPPVDLDDRDVCAAWWPARGSVLHQVGRCASTGRTRTKTPLTCVGEIEKHLDENADPNTQGPSARRRGKRGKQVVSSSEDEWLPHDESQETISDAEDDNILLLPEEWTNENQAGGIALCDALEVEYLDHGY